MEGWLSAFADQGLVHWADDELTVIGHPTQAELAASRQPDARF